MAPEIASRGYPGGRETWERLLALRPPVQRLLERMRAAGEIGAAADAELTVWAQDASEQALLESARETLRELLQVSNVRLKGGDPGPGEGLEALPERGLVLAVGRAAGQKCERCWQYRESVGRNEIHPTLCDECIAVLEGDGGG
jgi:isoleucyl-tRNA synthetase